jgi:hypothetical protein
LRNKIKGLSVVDSPFEFLISKGILEIIKRVVDDASPVICLSRD